MTLTALHSDHSSIFLPVKEPQICGCFSSYNCSTLTLSACLFWHFVPCRNFLIFAQIVARHFCCYFRVEKAIHIIKSSFRRTIVTGNSAHNSHLTSSDKRIITDLLLQARQIMISQTVLKRIAISPDNCMSTEQQAQLPYQVP